MRKIKMNRYGNWNGYEGTRKVWEFGLREKEAHQWVDHQEDYSPKPKLKLGSKVYKDFKTKVTIEFGSATEEIAFTCALQSHYEGLLPDEDV